MIPLFTSKQIREADAYGIKKLGIPGPILMENASRSIYSAIKKFFPELTQFSPIGFVAGKGNNGGDAFATARHFFNAGFSVKVISIGGKKELRGDALLNYNILSKLIRTDSRSSIVHYKSVKDLNVLYDCQLIVDGMLGTGAKGELREPYRTIVEFLNELDCYKAAIDCPTGLDLDTGFGELVFDADMTVTLAELKRGLYFGKGYLHSGEIFKGRIGLDDTFFDSKPVSDYLVEPEDAFVGVPERALDANKYSAGKVLIIAGSSSYPGASALTANAAITSGAGAVILAAPKSILNIIHSKVDSVVVKGYGDVNTEYLCPENLTELEEWIAWADVIAVGPGLGREHETLKAVAKLVENNSDKKFVIDADAQKAFNLTFLKKHGSDNKVFTPHLGEFSALMNKPANEIQKDILSYGKKFAGQSGSYLVLKGAPSIIFTPDGDSLINSSANPGLAKFGSGDVLTGLISSFIAQTKVVEDSVIAAVYVHGLAADILVEETTELGVTAELLLQYIPNAVKMLYETFV